MKYVDTDDFPLLVSLTKEDFMDLSMSLKDESGTRMRKVSAAQIVESKNLAD